MNKVNSTILAIYKASRTASTSEFQRYSISLIHGLIPHDNYRWVTVENQNEKTIPHYLYTNDPADVIVDWSEINRLDNFKKMMIENPGKAFSIHSPTFFAGEELTVMRDYTISCGHLNCLGMVVQSRNPGFFDGFSLYRSSDQDNFSEYDCRMLEMVVPHLVEASEHNRIFNLESAGVPYAQEKIGAIAIASLDGDILFSSQEFIDEIYEAFGYASFLIIPEFMMKELSKKAQYISDDQRVIIKTKKSNDLLFLELSRVQNISLLSKREFSVAKLYSKGYSYKLIARELELSPETIRSFLRKAYIKLKVNNKAELAKIFNNLL